MRGCDPSRYPSRAQRAPSKRAVLGQGRVIDYNIVSVGGADGWPATGRAMEIG
jgi:hypothetical protein